MKKFRPKIFTEEYAINVYIGKVAEIERAAEKYLGQLVRMRGHRGRAYNCLPDKQILILIDESLPPAQALSTLAHEACHAMVYIAQHLGIEDSSGEFQAHGIGAVMRSATHVFLKK